MLKLSWIFNRKPSKKQDNVYRKCNELPIHNFNEVSINNDFSYLKKNREEEVSDEVLQMAWLDILDEFLTISNNSYALNQLQKRVKMINLEMKLRVLEAMKYCVMRNVEITAELKQYRLTKEKLPAHIGLLKNDLARLTSSIPKEESGKNKRSEFDRTIAIIIKNGYHINRFSTTVSEYCAILNLITEQNKANKDGTGI